MPLLYPLLSLLKTEDFDKAFMNAIGVRPLLECLYSKVCVQCVCLCDCVSVHLCEYPSHFIYLMCIGDGPGLVSDLPVSAEGLLCHALFILHLQLQPVQVLG